MKGIFLVMFCIASHSCYAELSQLEDMDQYSISNNRALVGHEDSLVIVDKGEIQVDTTLGGGIDISGSAAFLPNQSNISVRDTGHTMTLKPILIQVGNADF